MWIRTPTESPAHNIGVPYQCQPPTPNVTVYHVCVIECNERKFFLTEDSAEPHNLRHDSIPISSMFDLLILSLNAN